VPFGLVLNPTSSYDTEGSVSSDEAHYENREITIGLHIVAASASALETAITDVQKHVGKINREGGSLEWTTPNGTVGYFDLEREATATPTFEPGLYQSLHMAELECRFVARPFWRGVEV
jgi:hypothetical protein